MHSPFVRSTRRYGALLCVPFFALQVFAQSNATGAWTGVTVLESTMMSASPPDTPVVACDALGHAFAVWTSPVHGVAFCERSSAGTWSAPAPLLPGIEGYAAQVAVGPGGVVAAAWVIPAAKYTPPKLAVSVRPIGGSFGTPTELDSGIYLYDSKLAVAASGAVTIAWSNAGVVKSATRSPIGTWTSVATLSPAGVGAAFPDLAMNAAGAAIVVWQQAPSGGSATEVGAIVRPVRSSAPWGAPQTIASTTGAAIWNPRVAIDPLGNAALGFADGYRMMIVRRSAVGTWTAPTAVSPPTDSVYSTAFAMDATGNVIAAWQSLDASNYGTISKRVVSATGGFGAVTVLSGAFEDAGAPNASLASDGSLGVVTWVDNTTLDAHAGVGRLRGTWTEYLIGSCWWNTPMPVAAGSLAASVVWPAPTGNPNVTNMVANVFVP